jgi:hypothetical protein
MSFGWVVRLVYLVPPPVCAIQRWLDGLVPFLASTSTVSYHDAPLYHSPLMCPITDACWARSAAWRCWRRGLPRSSRSARCLSLHFHPSVLTPPHVFVLTWTVVSTVCWCPQRGLCGLSPYCRSGLRTPSTGLSRILALPGKATAEAQCTGRSVCMHKFLICPSYGVQSMDGC